MEPKGIEVPSVESDSTEVHYEAPSIEVIEAELKKARHRANYSRALRNTIFSLLVVAAVAVIVAVLIMPVLQITGTSMTDTLQDSDIVVALRGSSYERGDVISFYYNNALLIKRVIAMPNEWVDIDEDGNVYVNGEMLDEPYITDKSLGNCNIELPYQVPEGKYFIMGDHRETSIDSRNTAIGCVSADVVVGRLILRVWPFREIGLIK